MDYQFLAIINPHSSHATRVKKRLEQLEKKLGHTVNSIESDKNQRVFTRRFEKIIKKLESRPTIILVGGGDGTVHQVVTATIKVPLRQRKNIILLPIWGGNANDFAYMLNGIGSHRDLFKLIQRGKIVPIHPLEIELCGSRAARIDYAICYASFGASAFAADVLDKSGPARKGKFHNLSGVTIVSELFRVVSAFLHTPPFHAQVNGERVEIFEQVFTNGSRMAKVDRLPVNLTDKAFYKVAQPSKNPTMVFRILKLLTGKEVGEVTSKPVSFQVKEPVLGQYDGEVIKIPEDTVVHIRVSKKKIYALTTRQPYSD